MRSRFALHGPVCAVRKGQSAGYSRAGVGFAVVVVVVVAVVVVVVGSLEDGVGCVVGGAWFSPCTGRDSSSSDEDLKERLGCF